MSVFTTHQLFMKYKVILAFHCAGPSSMWEMLGAMMHVKCIHVLYSLLCYTPTYLHLIHY
jgi:hypothetical protein